MQPPSAHHEEWLNVNITVETKKTAMMLMFESLGSVEHQGHPDECLVFAQRSGLSYTMTTNHDERSNFRLVAKHFSGSADPFGFRGPALDKTTFRERTMFRLSSAG
jgi:hypothetical protein